MAELASGFDCSRCGQHHRTLPLSFSVKAPLAASRISAWEIATRVVLSPDQCAIDNARFFLRGRIVLPILDCAEPFVWGVWAQVNPRDFYRTQTRWTQPGREQEPAFPGWLDTDLPLYGSTAGVEVQVQTQVVGRRPHFTLMQAAHPLAIEQQSGITLARAQQIAELLLHSET